MIRVATLVDRPFVAALARASLTESRERGAETLPSDQTLSVYLSMFDAYIHGHLAGVCLVDEGVGVFLAGEAPGDMGYEVDGGPWAYWWVGYIAPEARGKGRAAQLATAGIERLTQMGFKTFHAGTYMWNTGMRKVIEKLGMEPFQVAYTKRLEG